jgi:hypothetical protein
VTRIEEIEAALNAAYENRFDTGCGCCGDEESERARIRALETLKALLPLHLANLKGDE